jgi:hypothetical protein
MHAGGTKTWLATDDTFLAKNFVPGTSAFYGLYFTEKSGATQEYLNQQATMLASGMNADQFAEWWNMQMWSRHADACLLWMRYLEVNKGLYFRPPDAAGQPAGELPVPATAAPQQRMPQQKPRPELQQRSLKTYFAASSSQPQPSGAPAEPGGQAGRDPPASSSSTFTSEGQAERERGQKELKLEQEAGPFNEDGFPLKLIMPDKEILCPRAALSPLLAAVLPFEPETV